MDATKNQNQDPADRIAAAIDRQTEQLRQLTRHAADIAGHLEEVVDYIECKQPGTR